MRLKHFLTVIAATFALHGLAGGAAAQTYSNNFDSNTVGALPSGWVNIGSAAYKVVTSGAVSTPNALGETTYTDGDTALYTGAGSSSGGVRVQITETVSTSGTGFSNEALRVYNDSGAQNGYMVNPQWGAGVVALYKETSGSFASVGTNVTIPVPANGTNETLVAYIVGGTISVKVFPAGTAEPNAVTGSWTDSTYTSGYEGVRAGVTSGITPVPADDFQVAPATSTGVPSGTVTLATSSLIHKSPYNWHVSSASASEMETNCSGASVTFTDTGSIYALASFDVSGITAGAALRYRVDALAATNTTVPSSGPLQINLPDAGTHTVTLTLPFFPQGADRWATPVGVCRLVSIGAGTGGTLTTPTGFPAQSGLVYSDSRGEGTTLSDATLAWPALVAQGLGYEPGVRSFASEGWSVVNASGSQAGNIVPFFTPGTDAQSSWNKFDSSHSLLISGQYTPLPGICIACFGINDTRATTPGVSSAPSTANGTDSQVTASVSGWLTAERTATGAACKIVVLYDFSGDKRAAVQAGFAAYQVSTPDSSAYLVDIGTIAGLNDTGASYLSTDGAHPNQYGQSVIAAKIVQAIQAKLAVSILSSSGQIKRGR